MVELKLYNLIEKNDEDIIIISPKKNNKYEYKVIFTSTNKSHLEFKFKAKFINKIEFIYNNITSVYEIIPIDGILVSCDLDINYSLEIIIYPIDLCTRIYIQNKKEVLLNEMYEITWDKIYIINLNRRNDRKEKMILELEKNNIENYEFIEAIDGLDLEVIQNFNDCKSTIPNFPIVTAGHFACLQSHIKVIKLAKENNYSNIMILEDDIFFDNNFLEKIKKIRIPKYDMIYLGGIIAKKKLFMNNWAISNKVMGAYAYILNSSVYEVLIEKLSKLENYVDVFYIKNIQPNFKVFVLNDLIKTDLFKSDTYSKSKKMIKRLKNINKNNIN